MSIQLTVHTEAFALAQPIIAAHHPHLAACRILYVLSTAAPRRGGRDLLARTLKLAGLVRWLSDFQEESQPYDVVVQLFADQWNRMQIEQREALIDNELCRIAEGDPDIDGKPTFHLRGHDFEGFAENIERHGLWSADMQLMARAVEQQRLPGI